MPLVLSVAAAQIRSHPDSSVRCREERTLERRNVAPAHLPSDRYNPWRHAGRLNVKILLRALPHQMLGYWHFPSRTILLHPRLTQTERRCVLAHELAHVERGDHGRCASDWHQSKQEAEVHEVAARRLIRIEQLALALLLHDNLHDQAEELWVTPHTLRVRLECLTAAEREFITGRSLGA